MHKIAQTSVTDQNLVQVEIEALDENGILVFNTENQINISIRGDGKLIGLDSGNSYSHELYKSDSRILFQGNAMATILISEPGNIEVTVSSSVLQLVTLQLR